MENTVQLLGVIHQMDHGGTPTPWQGFTLDYMSTYYDEHLQQRQWKSRVHVFAQGKLLREQVSSLEPGMPVMVHGELIQRHPVTRASGTKSRAGGLDTVLRLKQIFPIKGGPE